MAQDPGEIREAIEHTRQEIGETVQAIAEKTDVKARASKKMAESVGNLKASTVQAKSKLGEIGQRVEDSLPDATRPVASTTSQLVSASSQRAGALTMAATQQWRRQPLVIIIASATLAAVLAASSLRRRRAHR